MRNVALFVFFMLLLFSCKKKSEYAGFSITESELEYKIHAIGELNNVLNDSDVVTFDLTVYSLDDSMILEGQEYNKLWESNVLDTGINELLSLLVIGDSASAILFANKVNPLIKMDLEGKVKINVVIKGSQPYAEWCFLDAIPYLKEKFSESEISELVRIVEKYPNDSIEFYNGVFLIREVTGTGNYAETDDVVFVHFEGFTSDGKLIDSTRKRNEVFSYMLGEQDQVISGLDMGVRRIKRGGKATVIIPSFMAFGSEGSSNGMIAPNEALVYQVEMIEITRSIEM